MSKLLSKNQILIYIFIIIFSINLYQFIRNNLFDKNKYNYYNNVIEVNRKQRPVNQKLSIANFDNFHFEPNITGYPFNIVPNIVHYVLFTLHEIQFSHFLSFLSVLRNQRPEKIYIHCDCYKLDENEYYKRLMDIINKTSTQLVVRYMERPSEIFGQKLSTKFIDFHSSDLARQQVLQLFGGIYLDRDVYVVQSLDTFLKYEYTLNWKKYSSLGNQVLIAHKNARFMKLYLDTYRNYDPKQWYYNAGILPTNAVLKPRPDLIHRVDVEFGVDGPVICQMLYNKYSSEWRNYYTIHMYIRAANPVPDWCFTNPKTNVLNKPKITQFNEEMAPNLNVTFGEMMREVFAFEKYLLKV